MVVSFFKVSRLTNRGFACISSVYPPKKFFGDFTSVLLKCIIRPDQHLEVLGLETYLNFQLKIHAQSLAYAAENYGILYTEIESFYGGWRRRLLAFVFFLLVVVAFSFGRYDKSTPLTVGNYCTDKSIQPLRNAGAPFAFPFCGRLTWT